MGKKYITDVNDIPKHPHYAVVQSKSVYIPADATAYHPEPAYYDHSLSYIVFDTPEEWEQYVREATLKAGSNKVDFIAIEATPAQVTMTVNVKLTLPKGK